MTIMPHTMEKTELRNGKLVLLLKTWVNSWGSAINFCVDMEEKTNQTNKIFSPLCRQLPRKTGQLAVNCV